MANIATVSEPAILTTNTYFWSPSKHSGDRRNSEEKYRAIVADFFRQIGMQVSEQGGKVIGVRGELIAEFSYSESCSNVYKHLSVTRNGKASNITQLRKLYQ